MELGGFRLINICHALLKYCVFGVSHLRNCFAFYLVRVYLQLPEFCVIKHV
jgi:hypothetical protein